MFSVAHRRENSLGCVPLGLDVGLLVLGFFSPRLWRLTLGIRRGEQRERGTSGRCLPSPGCLGSARSAPCCTPSSTSHNPVLLPYARLLDHLVRPEEEQWGHGQ